MKADLFMQLKQSSNLINIEFYCHIPQVCIPLMTVRGDTYLNLIIESVLPTRYASLLIKHEYSSISIY